MKLYTLKMVGIGPFAEAIEIDFRRFDDSGIFLLRGPTGSGKTTILDAIVYALYGEVTKEGKNSDARLRSHYLNDKDRAEVELVFGTSAGVFRIVREPAFQKAGNKSVTSAKATLTQVVPAPDGTFVFEKEIAVKPSQVGPEVTRLLGLNRAQFLQTIILPQGQFARFLSASSQERQKILQSIFGTQRFQEYQKQLVSRAESALDNIAAHQQALSTAYVFALNNYASLETAISLAFDEQTRASYPELMFAPFPEEDHLASSDESVRQHLSQVHDFVANDIQIHTQRLQQLRTENEHAQASLRTAVEYEKLTERSLLLAQQADSIKADEEALAQAIEAEPLREPLHQAEQSWDKLVQARSRAWRTVSELNKIGLLSSEDTSIEHLTTQMDTVLSALQEEKGVLKPLISAEEEFDSEVQRISSRKNTLASDQLRLEQMRTTLRNIPEKLEALSHSYTADFALSQRQSSLEDKLQELGQRYDAALLAIRVKTELNQAKERLTKQIDTAQKAHAHANSLRAEWLADAASSLAAELKDDVPCMVCGSSEHPAPASTREGTSPVTRVDVEKAQEASQNADNAVTQAQEEVAEKQTVLAELRATAQGSVDDLAQARAHTESELAQAQASAERLTSTKAEQEKLEQQKTSIEESISALEKEVAAEKAAIQAQERTLAHTQEQLKAARGKHESIRQRTETISTHESLLGEGRTCLNTLKQFIGQWESAQERVDQILHELGESSLQWEASLWLAVDLPATADDFISCILPDIVGKDGAQTIARYAQRFMTTAKMDDIRSRISAHHQAVKLTDETLSDEKFAQLTGEEKGIALEASSILATAEESHSQHLQHTSAVTAALSTLTQALDVVRECQKTLAQAQSGSEALVRLSLLASGDPKANNMTIPLSSWVLISLFGDVLAAANQHLMTISSGRYALETQIDNGDKRTRSGLDLVLIDYDVDELKRYPETLSGGETFYVSLALALGLSEIVTGEKGGIEIKSMFIDEGFGTLDPHTLDAVMDVLHQLHQEDRTIGIISHVEDLDKRISEQIIVSKKERGGSRIVVRA